MDWITNIIEFGKTAGIVLQFIINAFLILSQIVPPVVGRIIELVNEFFDLFDKKTVEGVAVTKEEKREATEIVVDTVLSEFHGSGPLVSESLIRALTGLAVYILKAMRYGEESVRNDEAIIHGYMGKGEDLRLAAQTHAGFKLFGI